MKISEYIEKYGETAYKRLVYRTHYENGGISPWYPASSNEMVLNNIGKAEFREKNPSSEGEI